MEEAMAKEAKSKVFTVDYKGLVSEIRKTAKELKKIEKQVGGKQKSAIAAQVKSLNYLESVCTNPAIGVAPGKIKPKMSGCKMLVPKMSKLYAAE
jgi:hypothetical protein